MWVTANYKETQLPNLKPGQSVSIHVDALKQDFAGVVESIGGSTGSMASILPPENATGQLRESCAAIAGENPLQARERWVEKPCQSPIRTSGSTDIPGRKRSSPAWLLQGCGRGGLQPSEQAILADTFPDEMRGMAFSVYGMAVVVAPRLGPTLGGWITDNYNWHWIFFINLPVGLLSLFLTHRLVEDPPWLEEESRAGIRIDYIGLALIVIGVACFQFVLDKGQEDDWFSSPLITTMCSIGVPILVCFFLWEWYHEDPIVDVRLLRNRNFGTAVFFSFVLGMVLFGSTVLIPEFLQSSLGYTAERAGWALSPGGLVLMLMMPIAGRLTATKVDPRLLIALGFIGTSIGLHIMTTIYLQIDFGTMVLLRMIQVSALPFIFIPISTLNCVGVPREKNNQISGLSNFARNIGGSIGTSLLTTFLARQNQVQQRNLTAHTGHSDMNLQQLLNGLTATFLSQGYDTVTSTQKALARLSDGRSAGECAQFRK